MQWGTISLAQDGSANATLPLAITTFISGWGSDTAANREYTSGIYVTANNTTSVNVAHIGYPKTARWFVISKQQWGKVTITETVRTYSFPIAFPSACYVCVGIANAQPSGFDWHMNELYMQGSLTGFTTYADIDASSIVWGFICLGRQQWGYSSSGRSVTFPITFPHFIFAALGTPDTNYSSATATGVHTLTLSNMGYVMHGSKGWWIAVGK